MYGSKETKLSCSEVIEGMANTSNAFADSAWQMFVAKSPRRNTPLRYFSLSIAWYRDESQELCRLAGSCGSYISLLTMLHLEYLEHG